MIAEAPLESLLECSADEMQESVFAVHRTGMTSDPFRGLNVPARLDVTVEPAQHNVVRPVDIIQSTLDLVTRIHGAFWCSTHIYEHRRRAEDQVFVTIKPHFNHYRMSMSYHPLLHILIIG